MFRLRCWQWHSTCIQVTYAAVSLGLIVTNMGGFRGGGKGAMAPPKRQKSPFALCIIALQLQVMQALIHCPFNTNTADICQLNPINGL